MKKITLTKKAKTISIISASAVVCVAVLTLVLTNNSAASQANAEAASDVSMTIVSPKSVSVQSISPNSGAEGTDSATGTWDPATQKDASSPLTTISKPSSTPSKPVVEGDSVNGQQPTNSALTDKTKKPTYTTKPTASASSGSTKKSSSSSGGTSSKSSGGSTSSGSHAGEVYDPVFGWTKPGSGKGTVVSGDWGGGSQIGIMD